MVVIKTVTYYSNITDYILSKNPVVSTERSVKRKAKKIWEMLREFFIEHSESNELPSDVEEWIVLGDFRGKEKVLSSDPPLPHKPPRYVAYIVLKPRREVYVISRKTRVKTREGEKNFREIFSKVILKSLCKAAFVE